MGMNIAECRIMVQTYWRDSFRKCPLPSYPEGAIPFKIGNLSQDTFLYHLEIDCGVYLEISGDDMEQRILDFKITDEKKYLMFLLRL